MLINHCLVTLAVLAQVCFAFYPWVPGYRCLTDGTCPSSKRGLGFEDEDVSRKILRSRTFQITQRIPQQIHLSQEERVRRLADRLTKKYLRRAPLRSNIEDGSHNIGKRENSYTIVKAATPTQKNSAGIDQDGTDYSYFAQVALGSKGTPMYMLLDTGAGTTWVMGPACTSDSCKLHNSFGPADSTTYKASTKTFSVSYGSGSVSGSLATDSLSIAGLSFSMTLGIADTTSVDFTSFPFDGILGLSMATGATPNFLDTLVASKDLGSNLFGIDLSRSSDGANTGEINFGAPDTSKYSGDLAYTAVSSEAGGDWAIPMDNLGLNGKLAGVTGRLAYIDTGTSYVFGPPADVAAFHKIVPGYSTKDSITYSVPCSTTTTAEFVFGGVSYSVSAQDWVGGPVGDDLCTSNFFGREVVANAWLLGDTFLKNVYSVFDVDGSRVGFAEKVITSSSTTSASSTGGPTPSDTRSSTAELPSTQSSSKPASTSATELPTSRTAPQSDSTHSTTQTQSNLIPTVSTSVSASKVPSSTLATSTSQSTATSSSESGVDGHETSATTSSPENASATGSGTTSGSTPSTSSKSSGVRLDTSLRAAALSAIIIFFTLAQ